MATLREITRRDGTRRKPKVAFVLSVAVLAVLQAWMFRTMARNWRRPHVDVRPTPVTTGLGAGV